MALQRSSHSGCWERLSLLLAKFKEENDENNSNYGELSTIIILSSGIVPPLLRKFCDDATALIKSVCSSSLNAKVIGSLYAGAIEKRGVAAYLGKAYKLGQKLTG
jgi:hypothetical protein